jgi:hypothetical protein
MSESRSNYFTKHEAEQPLSGQQREANQSCMLDHQNYYEDEIDKMQMELETLKQTELEILT